MFLCSSDRTDAHAAEFPSQVPSQLPSLTPRPRDITSNTIGWLYLGRGLAGGALGRRRRHVEVCKRAPGPDLKHRICTVSNPNWENVMVTAYKLCK